MEKPDGSPRVSALVHAVLAEDGVVSEALVRGILNHRALARWIIRTRGLDASEEAVLSAIRRAPRPAAREPFRDAYGMLARSHLNIRSNVCQITAPRSQRVQEKLVQIFRHINFERGEILYYTQTESGIKILVDRANLDPIRRVLEPHVQTVIEDLAAINVVEPNESLRVSGILALMSQALALQRINVFDVVFGFPEFIFFVHQHDALRTYQALEALLRAAHHTATGTSAGAARAP